MRAGNADRAGRAIHRRDGDDLVEAVDRARVRGRTHGDGDEDEARGIVRLGVE